MLEIWRFGDLGMFERQTSYTNYLCWRFGDLEIWTDSRDRAIIYKLLMLEIWRFGDLGVLE